MIKNILLTAAFQFLCWGVVFAQSSLSVVSPNGFLQMKVQMSDAPLSPGELHYEITYKGKPVILNSMLGITDWENRMEIDSVLEFKQCSSWKPVYGERSLVPDYFNEKTFIVKKKTSGERLHLIVRAYNEGIAFRYYFPENPITGGKYLSIDKELTTFVVPLNTYGWVAYWAQAAYQYLPVKKWTGPVERPLTLKLENGLYTCLSEAEMINYSRTKFVVRNNEENTIRCAMYGQVDEIAPFATPWRVIMVAENPKDLLANNDIIQNLNPSCQIENTNWIKPGKVIRILDLTTAGSKKAIDFAASRKIDYVHFDAGWYGSEQSISSDPSKSNVDPKRCKINDLNMPEVIAYAKSKGIGVWLYVNQRALAEHLDEILPLYQSWGVAGIKFGFVQVGSQRWTTWLHEAVKKCAKYQIMVDIHDEYRPTGFSRTYPNLLTQEGVRGNEEMPDANNNTILPFTRFIAGAADCTICYYHRRELKPQIGANPNARMLLNTACHQMALSVINYSPLQFLYWYDTPEDAQGEPELDFFDKLSTVWDDTKVLNGSIGEYTTIARRKGNDWFVGCITNNNGRKMKLSLDFLSPDKKYELTLYTDGGEKVQTRTHVKIVKSKVNSKTCLSLDLLPKGGCSMIIDQL